MLDAGVDMGSSMSENCNKLLTMISAFAGKRCIRSYAEAPYSAGLSGPKRPSPVPGWFHPGQSMCGGGGRGGLNPHDLLGSADFHTTSAFAASLREFVVWTIPSPFLARGLG